MSRCNHLNRAHPRDKKDAYLLRSRVGVVEASEAIPVGERVWSCATCNAGLPSLTQGLKLSVNRHLAACSGMTPVQNRYARPEEKARRRAAVRQANDKAAAVAIAKMGGADRGRGKLCVRRRCCCVWLSVGRWSGTGSGSAWGVAWR